jgi:GntR family transcriptional regulator/MocR family aminotransferase
VPISPIHLDRSDPEPLYRQIERQLRASIEDGRLRPGSSLPGIRSLARALNVAPNTVVLAYEQLAAEGYVVGHVGSGTQVAEALPETYLHARPVRRSVGPLSADDAAADVMLPAPNPWAPTYAVPVGGGSATLDVDFRPIEEERDTVPSDTWGRMLQLAFREMTDERAASGGKGSDPIGDPRLREALAAYLGAARAVRCTAHEVIITPGARATFAMVARIFTAPGRVSATEDPGDPFSVAALSIAGGQVVGVPLDRDGIRVDRLPSEAVIVHVAPSWQFPCGGTMPMRRREALLAWAHETGSLILEDDREGELRYEGPSLPSLQGMDRDGRVIYVGASRRFMLPGLDLSYAVVPPGLVDRFLGMIHGDGTSPGDLSQRAFARFIDEGHFERHLRRLRLVLAERQAVLAQGIEQELGWLLRADPAPAGSHLLVSVIDPGWTASAVAEVAHSVGMAMTPTNSLRLDSNGPDRELVVPYAARGSEQIRAGLRRLAAAVGGAADDPGEGDPGQGTAAQLDPVAMGPGRPAGVAHGGNGGTRPGRSAADPAGWGRTTRVETTATDPRGWSGADAAGHGLVLADRPTAVARPAVAGHAIAEPITGPITNPFQVLPAARLYRISDRPEPRTGVRRREPRTPGSALQNPSPSPRRLLVTFPTPRTGRTTTS